MFQSFVVSSFVLQIYSSSLKCLLPLLPTMLATSCYGNSKPISGELSDIIQRHLCSVQWEIRDTTLEFLSQVLEKFTGLTLFLYKWFNKEPQLFTMGVRQQIKQIFNKNCKEQNAQIRDICIHRNLKLAVKCKIVSLK